MPYYQTISAAEARQLLTMHRSCRILDIREPDEFASGHIPGAINIPLHSVSRRAPILLPSRRLPLLVCCQTGARSLPAVQVLSVMGYQNLYELRGGLSCWPYPLVSGAGR